MAADSYIQSALTELQNALNDLQHQMDELHRHTDQERSQLQHDLGSIDNSRKRDEVAITRMNDDTQRHVFYSHMVHLRHEADDKRFRLGQLDHELTPLLQRKTQVYNTLRNLMEQLARLQMSPDIR